MTRFSHTALNRFLNIPKFPEMPWFRITFATTSQSKPHNISTMVDKAMNEDGWLHIDIENVSWVWDKYRSPPYNQQRGATLDDLENERINISYIAKKYNSNVKVGVYWSQNEIEDKVTKEFDTARFIRQQENKSPNGTSPGLLGVVDYMWLGMYQSTEIQLWSSYLRVANRAKQVFPYWSDIPIIIGMNTHFYKKDETGAQSYDLLAKKIDWFNSELSDKPYSFDWSAFHLKAGKAQWSARDPYVLITRDYGDTKSWSPQKAKKRREKKEATGQWPI